MAEVALASCQRCGGSLPAGAAYCDVCGTRTREAARKVRFALRIELVFLGLVIAMLVVFAYVNLAH